jgi:hypothetical protein
MVTLLSLHIGILHCKREPMNNPAKTVDQAVCQVTGTTASCGGSLAALQQRSIAPRTREQLDKGGGCCRKVYRIKNQRLEH